MAGVHLDAGRAAGVADTPDRAKAGLVEALKQAPAGTVGCVRLATQPARCEYRYLSTIAVARIDERTRAVVFE